MTTLSASVEMSSQLKLGGKHLSTSPRRNNLIIFFTHCQQAVVQHCQGDVHTDWSSAGHICMRVQDSTCSQLPCCHTILWQCQQRCWKAFKGLWTHQMLLWGSQNRGPVRRQCNMLEGLQLIHTT